MSTTLITRETAGGGATVKDAPLTNAEIDSNFISLAENKLEASSNLADLTDTTAAKANLDLATLAFQNSNNVDITGGTIVGITDLAVADGGTGASDPASARANLELGSVATLDTGSGISQIRVNSDNENFFVTIDSNQMITGVKEFTEYTDFSGSSAIKVPVGNNIQRPTVPVAGQVRFNTVTGAFEGNYDGTIGGWGALGGPGSGTTTFLDVFPIGAIALWSGSITNIPEGWQLCDGSNGAPDLRDRFVVGAGGSYQVDSTGGSADAVVVSHSHTGNTASAGDHSHGGNTSNTGSHSHGGNTSNTGGHSHPYQRRSAHGITTAFGGGLDLARANLENANTSNRGAHSHNISTNTTGSHSHNISTDTTGAHTHTVSVSSTGESGTNKNLPPYYALAYIIKLTETIGQLIPENLAETIDTIENTLGEVVDDVDEVKNTAAPAGAVMHFAQSTAPQGWLKANGTAVSRTTYANLFAAIGTTFGEGDGSTTFNLPDLRGEFVRGWDEGRGADDGRTFGSSQSDENKSHTHTGNTSNAGSHSHGGNTSNTGNHSHNMVNFANGPISANLGHGSYDDRFSSNQSTGSAGAHSHNISTNTAGSHSHSISTNASGGSESRPRNIALLACIKF